MIDGVRNMVDPDYRSKKFEMTNRNTFQFGTLLQIFPFVNLILLIVPILLIFWTWLKYVTADIETIFIGAFMMALFIITFYYLALLIWGIKLVSRRNDSRNYILRQSLTILMINIIPMGLIYYFTS